jgi:hypothetical protein
MSYKIKDEFMDLAQGRHVVIFRNEDTGHEHQLINHINLHSCPTCGLPRPDATGAKIDFEQTKAETLATLNENHKQVAEYRGKHQRVRLGNTPKQ